MDVILLQDVKSLGKKGEIVKVSDGYARNFILPKKLGLEANAKNLNDLKLQKAAQAKLEKEQLEAAQALGAQISGSTVVIRIKTGENGRVFGSVSVKEIVIVFARACLAARCGQKEDFPCRSDPERGNLLGSSQAASAGNLGTDRKGGRNLKWMRR